MVDKSFNPLFLITEHRKTENVNIHTSINCIDLLLKEKVILYINWLTSDNCAPVLKLYIISGLANLCNKIFRTEGGNYINQSTLKNDSKGKQNFYINCCLNIVEKLLQRFVQKAPFPNFYNEGRNERFDLWQRMQLIELSHIQLKAFRLTARNAINHVFVCC